MKNILSIFFLVIYLISLLQSSWTLIDFYVHRDSYTKKFCKYLDDDITQCRASCYLEELLENRQKNDNKTKLISNQQRKSVELQNGSGIAFHHITRTSSPTTTYITDRYQFDFLNFVFHPPKG